MDASDASLPRPRTAAATTKTTPTSTAPSTTFTSTAAESPLAAHLAPGNLPISRITRAWDRKPQSPFSRKKVRFGKVWKRNGNALNHNALSTMFGGASGMFDAIGADSPARAVKKIRTEAGELVNAWEGRGSPTHRRIVTRGNHTGEELIALQDEEEEAPQQDASEEVLNVEVVNEDGTVEDVDDQSILAHDEWEDESVVDEAEEEAAATNDGQTDTLIVEQNTIEAQSEPEDHPTAHHDEVGEEVAAEPIVNEEAPTRIVMPLPQSTAIPEGFVSPVKERRRRPISQVKQANVNRRRTLPTNYGTHQAVLGPAEPLLEHETHKQPEPIFLDEMNGDQGPVKQAKAGPETWGKDELQDEVLGGNERPADEPSQPGPPDGEWEDVNEDGSRSPTATRDATPESVEQSGWVDTVENTPSSEEEAVQDARRYSSQIRARLNALGSPSKVPSSPIPTIAGPHPRLPLRRSPRRHSTSPMKKSSLRSYDKPHLIAFTPIKMPVYRSTEGDDPFHISPLPGSAAAMSAGLDDMNLPGITRSSSAPPEEPKMSPQKPKQPRISDDTALLQAFLKRATESKSGTNMSATARRESIENQRDSDTVRQALASSAADVAPVQVLADRDPNSPSPRKHIVTTEADDLKLSNQQADEIVVDPLSPKSTSRRSGRSRKTLQQALPTTTYSGPNKITVRRNQEPIVLKKTEAQELSYLTKANTKRNKGASILPRLKLTKMAKDGALEELPSANATGMDVDRPERKGVKWAETLVAFHEGEDEPEESTMMDELAPEPIKESAVAADHEMTGVPAPRQTPSKPKLRRLKPPRTASTPGKASSAAVEIALADAEQAKTTKPKAASTTKRKSRLATPAKSKDGVTTAVVDAPREEEPPAESAAAKTTTEKVPVVSKKKPTSRLPPPGSIAKPLAQGKENALTASPAKKRARGPAVADANNVPFIEAVARKVDFKSRSDAPAPGISSPAKKAARGNLFAGGLGEVEATAVKGRQEVPPSLASPAKKRSRRVAG